MATPDRWTEVLKQQADAEALALARIAAYRKALMADREAVAAEIAQRAEGGRTASAEGSVIVVQMHESERLRDRLSRLDDRIAQAAASELEQAERVIKARQVWEVARLIQRQRDQDRGMIRARRSERQWQDWMTTLKATDRDGRGK